MPNYFISTVPFNGAFFNPCTWGFAPKYFPLVSGLPPGVPANN